MNDPNIKFLDPIAPGVIPDLPIDASALSEMVCGRRYQLRCLYGLAVHSEDMDFGNAFHKWVEYKDSDKPADAFQIGMNLKVDVPKLLIVTNAFTTYQPTEEPLLDKDGNKLIEWKLSFPYKQLPDCNIHLLGTIDRLDIVNGYIRILDYKTTARARPEDTLNENTMRLQVYFYIWLMIKYGYQFLPPEARELVLQNKIFGQICVVAKNTNPVKVQYSTPFNLTAEMSTEIETLVDLGIDKARFMLIESQQNRLYPREGFLYGVCPKCAYNSICITNDSQRQAEYINNWKREPYDPRAFR